MPESAEIPTTENELQILLDARERSEDVKKIWPGFEKYRKENSGFEKEMWKMLKESAVEVGMRLTKEDEAKLREAGMLFFYGVKLGRGLQPELAKKVAIPRLETVADNQLAYQTVNYDNWGIIQKTALVLSVKGLLEVDRALSAEVPEIDDTQTVSEVITDRAVIVMLNAGVEEYAHEVFYRTKEGEKLLQARAQYDAIYQTYAAAWKNLDLNILYSIYHSSDSERRALVWKEKFMNRYFPHWMGAMKEHVLRTRKLRLMEKGVSRFLE